MPRYTAALIAPCVAYVYDAKGEIFAELNDKARAPENRRTDDALLNAAQFIADVLNVGAHMIATGART